MTEHYDEARQVNVVRFVPPTNDGFQMIRGEEVLAPKDLSAPGSAVFAPDEGAVEVMSHSMHREVPDMMQGFGGIKPPPDDQIITDQVPPEFAAPASNHTLPEPGSVVPVPVVEEPTPEPEPAPKPKRAPRKSSKPRVSAKSAPAEPEQPEEMGDLY